MQRGFHEPGEKPRRFYKDVSTAAAEGGFGVKLDARNLRSPGGKLLILPTEALAEMVAEEWAAQGEFILQGDMHAFRLANTAQDSIPGAREATAASVAQYAASELLCYFAEAPSGLVERQVRHWTPMLDRAQGELALSFVRAEGIVHREQPAETLARVKALALDLDDFRLAGLAFGAALFGSAVLAIGLMRGWLTGDQALELARLDEAIQEEQWGVDAEAAERTARLGVEARMLGRWFGALG
jgi:chaperone required for assembly of F1-ATPase